MNNLQLYKDDLSRLIDLGASMHLHLINEYEAETEYKRDKKKNDTKSFHNNYQIWFTESLAVIKQIIPDRYQEFDSLYKSDPKRKSVTLLNYSIQDWLTGIRSLIDDLGEKRFDDTAIIIMQFGTQLEILKSAQSRFDSRLFDLKQLVQADMFDSELESAHELLKRGFSRGAGAVSGVVLEKHLSEVCISHSIKVTKKNPTISYFNDLLKDNDVIDIPNWRFIQRLGDLRNLCDHNKNREPTDDEVNELISGVEKVTKTIY